MFSSSWLQGEYLWLQGIDSTYSFSHLHILQLFIKYLWCSRHHASYWLYRSEQSSYGLCLRGEYNRGKKTILYHSAYKQTWIQMDLVASSLSSLSFCVFPSPSFPPISSPSSLSYYLLTYGIPKTSQCSTDLVSLSLLDS